MTKANGGRAVHPHDSPPSVSDIRTALSRAALPSNAPEILAKNTIYVRDPAKIYALHHADRQRQFQLLVKRFVIEAYFAPVHRCDCGLLLRCLDIFHSSFTDVKNLNVLRKHVIL